MHAVELTFVLLIRDALLPHVAHLLSPRTGIGLVGKHEETVAFLVVAAATLAGCASRLVDEGQCLLHGRGEGRGH